MPAAGLDGGLPVPVGQVPFFHTAQDMQGIHRMPPRRRR
jgi:hypothetical protein